MFDLLLIFTSFVLFLFVSHIFQAIGRYRDALQDLTTLLKLDAQNNAAKKELEVVKDLWREVRMTFIKLLEVKTFGENNCSFLLSFYLPFCFGLLVVCKPKCIFIKPWLGETCHRLPLPIISNVYGTKLRFFLISTFIFFMFYAEGQFTHFAICMCIGIFSCA